jgi:tetratricopeptide (TPR) repeat protein
VACTCAWTAVGLPAAAQDPGEAAATRRFESGLAFARDGSHDEALTDFSAVLALYPNSEVADNALLEIARHNLDLLGDGALARDAAQQIISDPRYAQGDAALGAYLILGRALLMLAQNDEDREDGLASFQRGLRLHPDSDAVPEGMYHVAVAYQRLDRRDEAFEAYQRLISAHPQTAWAIRGRLRAAAERAARGDPVGAMEEFQSIRAEYPERPEAAEALAGTTILYRLYVRPRGGTYAVSEPDRTRRITRRVIAMTTDAAGNLLFATENGIGSLRRDLRTPAVGRPRGLVSDHRGALTVVQRNGLHLAANPALALAVPNRNREQRPLNEIVAATVLANGEWLVADGDYDALLRFRDGVYVGPYATVRARRLAVDREDRVAILDRDERILLYGDGREVAEIPTRIGGYRIDRPIDIAFDVLGHLYVLDREEGIYVFGRDQRLLAVFPGEERGDVPFDRATALAVDRFGRLFVADERDDQIYILR